MVIAQRVSDVSSASQKLVAFGVGPTAAATSPMHNFSAPSRAIVVQSFIRTQLATAAIRSARSLGNSAAFELVHAFMHVC
jgi:hypothetical protein